LFESDVTAVLDEYVLVGTHAFTTH